MIADQPNIAMQIVDQCLMGRTRYLSRVLSSIYDDAVRSFGVQASQVTPLAVIAAHGPVRRSEMGAWLHLDSSTLTRNLRVMLANGWLEEVPDERDARGALLQVTQSGRELLRQIGPNWQRAQQRAKKLLGSEGAAAVMMLFDHVQHAAGP